MPTRVHGRLSLLAIISAAVLACRGKDATGPSGAINIAGRWSFSDLVTNSQIAASCAISSTTVSFSQTAAMFAGGIIDGDVTCTAPGMSMGGSAAGLAFDGGLISGSSVSFTSSSLCSFTGNVSGNPANKMSGDASCIFPYGGVARTLTGTWQANR